MSELTISNIPDQVFLALQSLAARHNLPIEEYAKHLLCDTVALANLEAEAGISIRQLVDNFDAFLRVAEHRTVLFADEKGRQFALVPIAKFEQMRGFIED